jgi:hypothetical protein
VELRLQNVIEFVGKVDLVGIVKLLHIGATLIQMIVLPVWFLSQSGVRVGHQS